MPSTAPGWPGAVARWTASSKTAVGTAIQPNSRVWFTILRGAISEVYHPYLDRAQTGLLEILVTDGESWCRRETHDCDLSIRPLADNAPTFGITQTDRHGAFRIEKQVYTDPRRDALLLDLELTALKGALDDLQLYLVMGAHGNNQGQHNHAWVTEYKGIPLLCTSDEETVRALACASGWEARSAGYMGVSDGWTELLANHRLTALYDEAPDGNVAVAGRLGVPADGATRVALAFGESVAEAGQQARAALLAPPGSQLREYVAGWTEFHAECEHADAGVRNGFDLFHVSTAVLKCHEAKRFDGGVVASLSVPWGEVKGDDEERGYHLVWPRDHAEAGGAWLASGHETAARDALFYLMCTQEADGSWPQNMWVDGEPQDTAIQLVEVGLPVVLADLLRRADALDGLDPWEMIRRAADFIVRFGPVTEQDRWERNEGLSPFTLAVLITALLVAADAAEAREERERTDIYRLTADIWYDSIDRWTYAAGTPLDEEHGIDGHYLYIAPCDVVTDPWDALRIEIENQPEDGHLFPAWEVVSADCLGLVRFGLRAADDERILNSLRVLDATLRTETATGPIWHRYTHDGYGERADGSPYEHHGIGRGWPLLAGERAHYELLAGRPDAARELLATIGRQTSEAGLIPEQVWDDDDIPSRDLYNGRPSGSAMPLVWAHSELLKLVRSLVDGAVFDLPPQTVARYLAGDPGPQPEIWRRNLPTSWIRHGHDLRVELDQPSTIRWRSDGEEQRLETTPTCVGLHVASLPTGGLDSGARFEFAIEPSSGVCREPEVCAVTIREVQPIALRSAASRPASQ